jgi:hypothetical protein
MFLKFDPIDALVIRFNTLGKELKTFKVLKFFLFLIIFLMININESKKIVNRKYYTKQFFTYLKNR